MASACTITSNNITMSPNKFIDVPVGYQSYDWLRSRPCILSTREMSNGTLLKKPSTPPKILADTNEVTDLEVSGTEFGGFEFRPDQDPVDMLTADELFSDGKLVPLHLSTMRPVPVASASNSQSEMAKSRRKLTFDLGNETCLFSPKAPSCSIRWKELLGLRKLYQNSNANANAKAKLDNQKAPVTSIPSQNISSSTSRKSIRYCLHRSSKSSDSSLNLPLLNEIDKESISVSSRRSFSSSSSSSSSRHDHYDLPRLSLNYEKPAVKLTSHNSSRHDHYDLPRLSLNEKPAAKLTGNNSYPPRRIKPVVQPSTSRVGRSTTRDPTETTATTTRSVSVDSPRMNSYGRVIYHQSLERSSSSPSSFNGGPSKVKAANVRVTPVLNVPVCNLKGFPLFSSQSKKEATGGGGGGGGSINGSKNQMNRTRIHSW